MGEKKAYLQKCSYCTKADKQKKGSGENLNDFIGFMVSSSVFT